MGRSRRRAKGRADVAPFLGIPRWVLNSEQYIQLPHAAKSLLLDVGVQFRGYNNGDLSATFNMMKCRGWKSKATLAKALRALLESELLKKTRQGGKNCCCLYALGWLQLNDCNGKLDSLLVQNYAIFKSKSKESSPKN